MAAIQFNDPDQYVAGTPYAELARQRREAPLGWCEAHGGGFWLVTRHADIVAISRNVALFATQAPLLADPVPRELWDAFPSLAMIADNLMTYDHLRHPTFRAAVTSLFGAARIANTQPVIQQRCAEVLRQTRNRATFDFAQDVALPVAAQTILGDFLGVPGEELEQLSRCILTINAMDDPVFRSSDDALFEAAEELLSYGLALLRRLRAMEPDRSLLSQLAHSAPIGELTPEQFFLAYWFPLAAGAFDTTASTLAGGAKALIEHPAELTRLREDAGLIDSAAEELIRWVSPVIYFRRTATADTVLHGCQIRKGDKVVLCYASANRDESAFTAPDIFDVGRHPNPHVAFGYGPHYCLGARLASAVLGGFLAEFRQPHSVLELDGPVRRTRSAWMNRIWSMPVRWRVPDRAGHTPSRMAPAVQLEDSAADSRNSFL
jgi:cholest-4-en-3-one 26-monooxygenase